MTGVALYRVFDADGGLLYVGQSACPLTRISDHKRNRDWRNEIARIEVEWLPDRAQATKAEAAAIEREKPKWNVLHGIAAPNTGPLPKVQLDDRFSAISLGPAQQCILSLLAEHEEKIVSKSAISERLYSDRESPPDAKVIEVLICSIRKKLPPHLGQILNHRGAGYSFLPPESNGVTGFAGRTQA